MSWWTKSHLLCNFFRHHAHASIRHVARETGLSKSRGHRLRQALARRDVHPEAWVWETPAGRCWFTRLLVATLSPCGLKRGVGVDTISEFLARRRLERQVGWAPSALRRALQALEAALLETATTWETAGGAGGEPREMIGAVDATFLEQRCPEAQPCQTRAWS
jgi:hypothetical protein